MIKRKNGPKNQFAMQLDQKLKRHRFPVSIISQAVWLYHRFNHSYRDVQEQLAFRGILLHETVRDWCRKFANHFRDVIKKRERNPSDTWHLDEMTVKINGEPFILWRAVDSEGIELDVFLQKRRNKKAALEDVVAWQNRALEPIYPILYLDCLVVKVKENNQISNKSLFLAVALNMEGHKEVLGMWIAKNEGAKFWLSIITELKNRGVEQIYIACVDGLKGFTEVCFLKQLYSYVLCTW